MSSSSFLARWLYRALLGAAFGRLGWKEFWKWALPKPKPSLRIWEMGGLFREYYLEPMKKQLEQKSPFMIALDEEVKGAMHDHQMDMLRYVRMTPKPKPLTRTQKLKRKIRYKLHRLKPVLITQGKLEDVERDY